MRRSCLSLRNLPLALILASFAGLPARGFAGCQLAKFAELPVTMNGLRPMVHAQINGADALFVADSGAFYRTLSPAAGAAFKLRLTPAPYWFAIRGLGGEARTWLTTVKTFTIFNVPVPNVDFLVAGNDLGGGAAGVLGQNVFRIGDTEYDLANGVIRIMRVKDCSNSDLAYWAQSQPHSVIDIERATATSPHTTGVAFLNGARIHVMFDTGAGASLLTLDAAKRAGVTPDSEGVVPAGAAYGYGPHTVGTWIAPFASFRIGDEEVRSTRLRIGESGMRDADMLIGADFFLSHHIYVANSQRKLYFTYNGGPVFNLTSPAPAAGNGPATESPAPSDGRAEQPSGAPGFSRRGAAFAARRDFEHAIADLTRACQLAPTEASYFYQRAMAYVGNKQPDQAMADLDQALKLQADDLPSLAARAQLHAQRREIPAAIADLDAADRVAPKESLVRIQLGTLYLRAEQFAAAITQFNLWIGTHDRNDIHTPQALNLRCWARALWGQDLDQALADCNAALKASPDTGAFLASRGLTRLRRGEYDKAIADYDRAVALRPDDAWSRYFRGIAELRQGAAEQGNKDIAAATALEPGIADAAGRHGIAP